MRASFLKIFFFFAVVGLVVSCDKDYNEIGSGIVGEDHFGFEVALMPVLAYNQFYGPVQTSKASTSAVDMPINALGYYNNSVFGKVKASFVTQLELDDPNPTIDLDLDPQIEKVELNIPYFATRTDVDDDGNSLYELDSLQGSSKIKLSVFASGYYLRDFDPSTGFQEVQKYYSDQADDIAGAVIPGRLNNSSQEKQNDQFYFDPAEIVTYTTNDDGLQVVDERRSPEMRLQLRNDYFQEKLFSASAQGKLVTNNVFKEWCRGLYFKVEEAAGSPNQGSLAKMNFKQGTITVTYTEKEDEDSDVRTDPKTLVLNLAGNTVNLFENEYNTNYLSQVTTPDLTNGDSRIWLKGGAGSMAVIKLFPSPDTYGYDDDNDYDTPDDPNIPNVLVSTPNGVPDELDELREKNWLINDASLSFFLDEDQMNPDVEQPAYRLYLYDLKNKKRLVDYDFDVTTVSGAPQFNKFVHGGIYIKEKKRYTIRLTNHIRNLVDRSIDSANVELGLVVTESISSTYNTKLKTALPGTALSGSIDVVPGAATTSQRGVVLYGSNPAVIDEKRLQLKIYYTKKE